MIDYWEKRYKDGHTSGAGSYGIIGEYKTKVINDYIKKYFINTITDLGCGDGHQIMSLTGYKQYDGFDISKYAIDICKKNFSNNDKMNFYTDITKLPMSDLCLSLDVLYHIIDNNEFTKYLLMLFTKSKKYVLIFSTNYSENANNHILHRKFTEHIDTYQPEFKLIEVLKNTLKTSANFYLYERK